MNQTKGEKRENARLRKKAKRVKHWEGKWEERVKKQLYWFSKEFLKAIKKKNDWKNPK